MSIYNSSLDAFLLAADEGSFNKAALTLYISPPAVIKQINMLESELGVTLFHRTHRGLTLTAAGQTFYDDARQLRELARDAITRTRNASQTDAQIVRIGSSPLTPTQFFLAHWPAIHELAPGLKFQLVPFENTSENAHGILTHLGRDIDVVAGIFDAGMLQYHDGCKAKELLRTPLCCAISAMHPLANKRKLTIEDLYGQQLLIMKQGWSSQVDALRVDLKAHHPTIKLEDFDQYSLSIFNRCVTGQEVLLVIPEWRDVHPLIKILPIDWDYTMPYGLFHSPTPSRAVQTLLETLQTIL